MADKHLNLFYSYNTSEDAELIENNLTRAFIQTLRAVSCRTRNRLLWSLDKRMKEHDFSHAEFALQGHIDQSDCDCESEYIVTIETRITEMDESQTQEDVSGDSIPDAWIFDKEGHEYCVLIECKRGDNPISPNQIHRHAKYFVRDAATVPLTWYGVLRAVEVASTQAAEPNELEPHILMSLTEYLGYFGYRLFRGFRFAKLQAPPDWRLFRKAAHRSSFRSDGLLEMPGFRPTPQAVTPKGEGLCRFEHLGAVPSFRLCSKKGDKRER